MYKECGTLSRGKDNTVGSFHGCQCFRAKKGQQISSYTKPVLLHVIISRGLPLLWGPATERQTWTEGGYSRHDSHRGARQALRISERSEGRSSWAPENDKRAEDQVSGWACTRVSKDLFTRTLLYNTRMLLLLTRYQNETVTVEKEY